MTKLHFDCRICSAVNVVDIPHMSSKNIILSMNCANCNELNILEITLKSKPRESLYKSASWLQREYLNEGRTQQDLADQFGVTPMTISHWLKKHGIPARPRGRGK